MLQRKNGVRKVFVILFAFVAIWVASCPINASAATQEVTIYGLNSTYLEKITIPANMPQSYQISVGNGQTVTYKVTSGQSVKVSDTGYITPAYTYWKRGSGYSYSVREGQEYDYYTLKGGDSTVTATTGGVTYTFQVHVVDYSTIYCEQVMDAYIAANITEDMTDLELVKAICRFPAGYDYSASYSNANSMIINGGGDCWASTDAIITLCEKLKLKAWTRNGNRDPGAGSGHMNAMVELNGKYYELEAGYASSKGEDGYRMYSVKERTTLFSYTRSSAGATIYQYDGYDQTGILEIPKTVDGYTVIGIAEQAFARCDFTSITLPDSMVSIGDFAFSSCDNMTAIHIPASVSSIGTAIFADCNSLKEITVASANAHYQAANGVIYSKDGTVLVTCPAATDVTIIDTVTEIAPYAFYYNANITSITIPSGVTKLEEAAFGNCSKLASVNFKGNELTTIGNHCFRSNSALSKIKLPASVTSIGAYAFAYCSNLDYIYFMGNAPTFGADIDGTYYDKVFISCTTNAYYPEGNDTWTAEVTTNHGGTITWTAWTDDSNTGDNKDESAGNQDGTSQNNKEDSNSNDSANQTKYYDSETGIYVSISSDGTQVATFTAMDKSKAKGTVKIPDVILVDGVAYSIVGIDENAFKNNTQITSVKIGNNVKTIEDNAFSGCSKLRSVSIGKNVTTIGDRAFYKCKKLTRIVLGTKVTIIQASAFEGCTALKTVTVKSKKLKTIGKSAFKGCKKLQTISLKTTKLNKKSIGKNALKGTNKKLTIKVPKKYVKKYKTYFKNKGNKSAKVKKG